MHETKIYINFFVEFKTKTPKFQVGDMHKSQSIKIDFQKVNKLPKM